MGIYSLGFDKHFCRLIQSTHHAIMPIWNMLRKVLSGKQPLFPMCGEQKKNKTKQNPHSLKFTKQVQRSYISFNERKLK